MRRVKLTLLFLSIFFVLNLGHFIKPVNSASQDIKDQMSNPELSYFARMAVGTSVGNSIFKVQSSGNPSLSTSNLFIGTTLAIGNTNGGSNLFTVSGIASTADIQINSTLSSDNAFPGAYVIATNSAIHTVSFSPASSVLGGVWQVLIKATSLSGETPNDGIPDQGGFDIGSTTPSSPGPAGLGMRLTAADITCPWSAVASVGTTMVLSSADVGINSAGTYHVINCALPADSGNPVGTGSTGTIIIGRSLTSGAQIINPAPAISHTEGRADATADTYTFVLRHTDNTGTLLDISIGKIAVFEGVRISAPVDPTLTFFLDAPAEVGFGQTRCGSLLSGGAVYTTATTINFASLKLLEFNNLAQRFSCTTNARDGYTVQVFETTPLTSTSTGATIPDTNCDDGTACSITTENTWTSDQGSSRSEFGYSLEAIGSGQDMAFTSGYKPFGIGYDNAQTIMSRASTPDKVDQAYICYRATASSFQEAGNYENGIIFLATARF
jgi:hypothetical protein